LITSSREGYARALDAFRQALGEVGYVENRNITIEYRFGNDELDRLAGMEHSHAWNTKVLKMPLGSGRSG
jgi:hypothetical protein